MRRIIVIALIGLLGVAFVLATLGLGTIRASAERSQAEALRNHTMQVIIEAERLTAALEAMQRGQRGYLLTESSAFLEPYFQGSRDERVYREKLRRATRDNPRQQASLASLDRSVADLAGVLRETINLTSGGRTAEALAIVRTGEGRQHMRAINGVLDRIVAEEQRLLETRSMTADEADRRANQYTLWLTVAGTGLLALAAALGATALRHHVQRAEIEQLLRSVLASVHGAVFAKNAHGKYTLMSEVGAKFFGRSVDDIVGRTDAEIHPPLFADTAAEHEQRAAEQGAPVRFDEAVILDGHERHLSVTRTVLHDLEGNIAGTAGVAIDVTAWRQSETKLLSLDAELASSRLQLEQILEALPIGVVVCDAPSGAIRFGNRTVEQVFRHPVLQSRSAQEYGEWESYHADGRRVESEEYPLARVLAEGEPAEGEFHYRRGDGTMAWVRILGAPIRNAQGEMDGGVVAIVDVDEQRRLVEHQRLLAAELSHRVKNVLAVVQAIATATLSRSNSLEQFAPAFEGRLAALSTAHGLLLSTNWRNLSFRDLATAEMAPYQRERHLIRIEGPNFQLGPKQGVALALILHELSTNSAKHGAIGHGGQVTIAWTVSGDDGGRQVRLKWEETGLGSPPTLAGDGFGSRLIRRSVSNDLRGRAERIVAPDGVSWEFDFLLVDQPGLIEGLGSEPVAT
ncbi:CHASE3 domain-containing protein [Sphingomonas sp. LHG3406-1]|uniref:CHASE3 domain-containing protein n=1 Tax=Sphingomonas sp. LHG3406-1 TaxID=2804617 RepID=UPI00262A5200|nr:CHASE3 domain-containing protein [Sphingomonas sp. LHG3406-1]